MNLLRLCMVMLALAGLTEGSEGMPQSVPEGSIPVNVIDPVSGLPVDRHIIASFTIKGPATITEHGPVHLSSETVLLGFADEKNLEFMRRLEPERQGLFISAAKRNWMVIDGRLAAPPGVKGP